MKTAGIVCEYNPMHNGHLLHIRKTKEAGAEKIVCVLSGDYVQRGECALLDKRVRAEAAVRAGADLVLELPVPWSCASAQDFAFGALSILNSVGIDILSFGAETADSAMLEKCALASEREETAKLITDGISEGLTYPAALSRAYLRTFGNAEAEIAGGANNVLALEYIRAAKKIGCRAELLAVKRFGAGHDSVLVSGEYCSASYIRSLSDFSRAETLMPEYAFKALMRESENGFAPCKMQNGERAVLSALRKMSPDEISLYADDGRGLSQRIFAACKTACSLEELYALIKTKNITMARVRRAVLAAFLEISPELSKTKPPYIRILAANESGLQIAGGSKSEIPIVARHSEIMRLGERAREYYELSCRCSDLYGLFSKKIRACSREQTSPLIVVK